MMRRAIPFIIAVLAATTVPALAQVQPATPLPPVMRPAPDPAAAQLKSLGLAYQQLGLAIDQALAAEREKTGAAQRHLDDLRAYAKACGDKPGCFLPVPAMSRPVVPWSTPLSKPASTPHK